MHFFRSRPPVIWVLTAGFGDGHNTAAKNVTEALRQRFKGERIESADLFMASTPLAAWAMQCLYRLMIVHFPGVWRGVYDRCAQPAFRDSARMLHPVIAELERIIERDKPRAIVSTFPVYSGVIEVLRRSGVAVPRLITVITDSIEVHPAWLNAPSDLLCVPDDETAQSVQAQGGPADKVRVTGFPVSLLFAKLIDEPKTEKRVLYMPSTQGSHTAATLAEFRELVAEGVRLSIVPGRHSARLYHVLRRFADSLPADAVRIHAWTDQIPRMLQTHDVLVCKAGGAILHEAFAAQIPAVVDYIVPGQEQGNAEMLSKYGCGLISESPADTLRHVKAILADNGKLRSQMSERMKPLSVPDAAMRVADLVDVN